MKKDKNTSVLDKIQYIELIKTKLEAVMPEVHRQVRVYEEKLMSGKLNATPKNFPLFSE